MPDVPPKQDLLEEALRIVTGPRQQLYGRPSQNFIDTAALVTPYLRARGLLAEGKELEAYDIAIIIDLLKTARIATSPGHKDNWVDKAGYSACGWEAWLEGDAPSKCGGWVETMKESGDPNDLQRWLCILDQGHKGDCQYAT